MQTRPVGRRFLARDPLEVAPELLGLVLEQRADGQRLRARIVEVEAYRGAEDPGSHAYRGLTPRTKTLFGPAGHLYVYFTYGMHWCMNVVCGVSGTAAGVLLRAAEPVVGLDVMRTRRPKAARDRDLLRGPARLTQAFGIDGSDDGRDLCTRDATLRLLDDGAPRPVVETSTRIGLGPGRGEALPFRFTVAGSRFVSG